MQTYDFEINFFLCFPAAFLGNLFSSRIFLANTNQAHTQEKFRIAQGLAFPIVKNTGS